MLPEAATSIEIIAVGFALEAGSPVLAQTRIACRPTHTYSLATILKRKDLQKSNYRTSSPTVIGSCVQTNEQTRRLYEQASVQAACKV